MSGKDKQENQELERKTLSVEQAGNLGLEPRERLRGRADR